jgi:hypothetical protein
MHHEDPVKYGIEKTQSTVMGHEVKNPAPKDQALIFP